ncbi:MAG: diguanylate cyclase [Bacillota bacterium]|nr:diguanylate cyclase [Bacillota bacterium]
MRKWVFIFSLLTLAELIDEIGPLLVPSKVCKYVSIVVFLGTMVLLLFLFRKMDLAASELRVSRQKLKNIFDTLNVAIWSHDLKTDTLLITPGIEKLYGYSLEEFYQDYTLWKKVIHPDDSSILIEREKKLLVGEQTTSEYRIIRPDGEVRWIQDSGFPTIDEYGNYIDFNSVLFDITDRKESEYRYRSLVEMSPDIVAVASNGKIDYINGAGVKLLGAEHPHEIIGKSIELFAPIPIIEKALSKEEAMRFEFQMTRLDGKRIDVETAIMPIQFEGRLARQIVGRDITDRKKSEETIKTMAFYDTLTGLPNRNMFRTHLNEVLRQEKTKMAAVLFLDLDRFKIINDTKGHTTGDLLLQKVAERLQGAIQNDGIVSRQGGDEFIILLENMDKKQASIVAERILDHFSKQLEVHDQEFFVTPSIGISLYPTDGYDEETLIKNADIAMYLAKEHGKNNYQFYSSRLNVNSIKIMELENGLRKALEQNQFVLHYQPQIELETEKIV